MKRTANLLLDTNVVIALFAGEPAVLVRIQAASQIYLPIIAFGELYCGALGSSRRQQNIQQLENFAQRIAVLHCDEAVARRYAELKAALLGKGSLIPENDIWIAAIAIQHDLILLTRDRHFRSVENLTTEAAEVH